MATRKEETKVIGDYTPFQVKRAEDLLKLLPLLVISLLFWSTNYQISTTLMQQGCQMRNDIGGFEIMPGTMASFHGLCINRTL